MDKVAVAEALERAADLYEAEEIGWCKFKWVSRDVAVSDGDHPLGLPAGHFYHTGRITMCAEGAILKAVGFDNEWIDTFGDGKVWDAGPGEAHEYAYRTFYAAVTAVESRLPPLGHSLAGWNDQKALDKAEVIELFKVTAKDLRNGQ